MRKERLRAPVWWFGGKGNMLAKLTPNVPEGRQPYCEPYMGAAMAKVRRVESVWMSPAAQAALEKSA